MIVQHRLRLNRGVMADGGRPVCFTCTDASGSLGDGQGSGMGNAVALADDEALEGVVDVEVEVAARRLADLGLGEAHLGQVHIEAGEDFSQQPGVAPLGPSADRVGRREVEGPRPGADDAQRWQALHADDPVDLPWIAGALERLGEALRALGD